LGLRSWSVLGSWSWLILLALASAGSLQAAGAGTSLIDAVKARQASLGPQLSIAREVGTSVH